MWDAESQKCIGFRAAAFLAQIISALARKLQHFVLFGRSALFSTLSNIYKKCFNYSILHNFFAHIFLKFVIIKLEPIWLIYHWLSHRGYVSVSLWLWLLSVGCCHFIGTSLALPQQLLCTSEALSWYFLGTSLALVLHLLCTSLEHPWHFLGTFSTFQLGI